jgi:hypothetical protein
VEIELFEYGAQCNSLCLWCWVMSEVAFWMLLPAQRNVKFNSGKKDAIFAHELRSALMLTVEFPNIY